MTALALISHSIGSQGRNKAQQSNSSNHTHTLSLQIILENSLQRYNCDQLEWGKQLLWDTLQCELAHHTHSVAADSLWMLWFVSVVA